MDDPIAELQDAGEAKKVQDAINTITGDLIRNSNAYPSIVRDLPRIATAMEKSIKGGNYKDAISRARQLDQHIEAFAPVEESAQEAKLVMRHRLLVIAKLTS